MKSVMTNTFNTPDVKKTRTAFNLNHGRKFTFDADYLVPCFLKLAYPGDTFKVDLTALIRMIAPLERPIMDNLYCDIHFFEVQIRNIWDSWREFLGERPDADVANTKTVPQMTIDADAANIHSLADYLGLVDITTNSYDVSALPFRAYNSIYDNWYRPQHLIDEQVVSTGDADDAWTSGEWPLRKRPKWRDYFTSCQPWLQKGTAVALPLTGTIGVQWGGTGAGNDLSVDDASYNNYEMSASAAAVQTTTSSGGNPLYIDLARHTNNDITDLREAYAQQYFLEQDSRYGTRMPEKIYAHFGVRMKEPSWRPVYLGGGTVTINSQTVPQTSEDNTTKQGSLAAFATGSNGGIGFVRSFDEHCYVMGICSVRADLTYSQGIDKEWFHETEWDFAWPEFENIGEEAVLKREIFFTDEASGADGTTNASVFGYQERYAHLKHARSSLHGYMRVDATSAISEWHLSQDFASAPSLGQTFIESTTPMDRILKVNGSPHFVADFYYQFTAIRPFHAYSIPTLGGTM